MSVILSHTETVNGQSIKIAVSYDATYNEVSNIESVHISYGALSIPVGDLFILGVAELEVAINKIVDRVDWREIYRNQ